MDAGSNHGSAAKGSAIDLEVAESGPVSCHFWGAFGAPILVSVLGNRMASCSYVYILYIYRIARNFGIAGNFGGKNIWRIALIVAFGRFYFGGWVSLIP